MANTVFDKSIFKQYFDANDAEALAWASNVLNKLDKPGQVAKYIKRTDKDGIVTRFRDLFNPITIFFAYFVRLARVFRDFKTNDYLAKQYLDNAGQYTSSEETVTQLQYLITNLLRTRAKRGTTGMYAISTNASIPDGELLRLVDWKWSRFFKLGVARPQRNGWNVNNSSPLNRSNTGRYDLNLAWENSEDVRSLIPYPLQSSSYCKLSVYRGKNCLEIEGVPFNGTAGIGGTDLTKAIVVDPRLNYEITFYIAQDTNLSNISFGCRAFDSTGVEIGLSSVVDNSTRKWFFETRRLNRAGKFYMIRGILYNKDIDVMTAAEAKLNIGFGTNLKMNDNVVSIIPYVVMDNKVSDDSDTSSDFFAAGSMINDPGAYGSDASGPWVDPSYDSDPSIYIWNFKVTPCNTAYNRCYLDNKNFIDVYMNNLNGRYTNKQIDDILRKYFIPYNSAFKSTHIGEITETNPNVSLLLLESGDYILLESEDRILLEQQ